VKFLGIFFRLNPKGSFNMLMERIYYVMFPVQVTAKSSNIIGTSFEINTDVYMIALLFMFVSMVFISVWPLDFMQLF
jgi:hypothetical protein